MEFLRDSKGRCKAKPRQGAGPARVSAVFALVFSAIRIYLAENVGRPGAENVMGLKDFIGSRRQAMEEGVRKAARCPKHYGL